MKTTIEVYTFSIRKKNGKKALNFFNEMALYKLLSDKHDGIINFIDTNANKEIKVEKSTLRNKANSFGKGDDSQTLFGIIETGHYGKEYNVVDSEDPTDKEKASRIDKNSAILKPFFYYFKIPSKGTKALLILERVENNGILSLMRTILISFLNYNLEVEDGYSFDKFPYISKQYMKEIVEGKYSSYTITNNSLSKDVADRYCQGFDENDITLEFKVKFRKGMSKISEKKMREIIESGGSFFNSKDFEAAFEGGTKKVVSNENGKERTLYLNNEKKNIIKPYYDIDVNENKEGFSDFDSIKKKVEEFILNNNELNIID